MMKDKNGQISKMECTLFLKSILCSCTHLIGLDSNLLLIHIFKETINIHSFFLPLKV
jgi:hypothetical protein